jgi:GDP-4-dehydro-6-deoxy-D-mannose reductase
VIGTALLTGASGFVGTYLQAALREAFPGLRLVGLSVPSTSSTGGCDVDLCDAGAVDAVVERVRPDIVIHLAAQASVAKLATERNATFAINVGGTLNLALAVAAHAPNATFIFASSAEVYGASFLRGRLDESAATVPARSSSPNRRWPPFCRTRPG